MEPVSPGELLLQRIADRLDSIDAKLGRGLPPETHTSTRIAVPAKKTASRGKKLTDVDGR